MTYTHGLLVIENILLCLLSTNRKRCPHTYICMGHTKLDIHHCIQRLQPKNEPQ